MSAKPIYKDAQMTVRISGEVLDEMKAEAKERSLSLADFVLWLYQDHKQQKCEQVNLEARVQALEQAVFQSQAA